MHIRVYRYTKRIFRLFLKYTFFFLGGGEARIKFLICLREWVLITQRERMKYLTKKNLRLFKVSKVYLFDFLFIFKFYKYIFIFLYSHSESLQSMILPENAFCVMVFVNLCLSLPISFTLPFFLSLQKFPSYCESMDFFVFAIFILFYYYDRIRICLLFQLLLSSSW